MELSQAQENIINRVRAMLDCESDPQRRDLIQWFLANAEKGVSCEEQDAIYKQIME